MVYFGFMSYVWFMAYTYSLWLMTTWFQKKQFILLCHGISIIHNLLMFCSCYTCHKHHGDVVRTSPLPFIFFPNWDYGSKAPAVPQQEPWIESVPKSFFDASRAQHWIGMHWDWCAPLQDVVVIGQWWLPPRYVKKTATTTTNNQRQLFDAKD